REPSAQPRQRPALEQAVELTLGARRQRTGRERCPPPARDRAELGRRLSDDELLAAALQVDAALLPAAARVRGRIELADQPQLLERGLELRAEHAPFDPVEREQRGLDRGSLALAAEVRAQPGPEVARPADVQHLAVPVTKEVDPRFRRGAASERALVVDAPFPRSRQRTQLGEMPRAELLG